MFIPDCQLTAFILDAAWVLIKDTSTLLCSLLSLPLSLSLTVSRSLSLTVSRSLSLSAFHSSPPYLEVDAGSVSEGDRLSAVRYLFRTLY